MLGPFINILDTNVVNVALPRMMSGLATDVLTIRWVVTAYLIATAVMMPALGWLGRAWGNKHLYALGLTMFTSASLLCGMAPTVEILILLRIIQGLGAGVLMPISFALMMEVSPPQKRGMGTSLWAIGASLGGLVGLPVGGYFADAMNWHTVFYVNLLPGTLAVVLTLILVPPATREERLPFDAWGFLTLSLALVSMLMALSQGPQEGWDSPYIRTLLAVCAGAVSLFLLIELRTTTPLLDLRLYTSLRYISGTLIAAALGVFFYASSFLVVLFAQLVLDFSVQHTALVLIPGSCTMILVALLAGWLVDRSEPRLPMLLGLTFYGVFCYLMVLADRRIGMVFLVWVYIFRGMGLGFLNAPVFAVATSGLNLQRTRAASSLLSLWLVLGGTFGIALLSTMLERWQTVHQTHFAEEQWLTSIGTQHALTAFTQLAATLGAGGGQATLYARSMLQGVLRREALVHAFNDGFALMISITLACIGVVLTMRIARQR